MSNFFDSLITIIIGTITNVSRAVNTVNSALRDFFYIKVSGASFIVLGARQTGKTTLIHWLRANLRPDPDFDPDPTAAGGQSVPEFNARVGEGQVKLKPVRDVGGEYAMWETDWVELFREAQPNGILFLIDHTDPYAQKDALNFVMQMIEDEPAAAKALKAFYILINKEDLWGDQMNQDDILQHYRNEQKRLKAQAERLGFQYAIRTGSLKTNEGVPAFMSSFIDQLRPRGARS